MGSLSFPIFLAISRKKLKTKICFSYQGSPYNLRPRNIRASPDVSPASRVESAKSFSKTVQQMQEISEKNSRLIRAYQQMGVNAQSPSSRNGRLVTLSPLLQGQKNSPDDLVPIRAGQVRDFERSSIVTRSSRSSMKEKLEF